MIFFLLLKSTLRLKSSYEGRCSKGLVKKQVYFTGIFQMNEHKILGAYRKQCCVHDEYSSVQLTTTT
jgi:hypothetical protein